MMQLMYLARTLLLAVCMTSAVPAIADSTPFPANFTATYVLEKGNVAIGKVERRLRPNGDGGFIYESDSHTTGFVSLFVKDRIHERTEWRYVEDVPQPFEYVYSRTGGKKERRVQLLFNWDNNQVTNIVDNDPWRMKVPDGTQDKLLYQLTIMQDLNAGARGELSYPIADGGHLKTYQFEVTGEETVTTPLGRLQTVKLTRTRDDRVTTIWCAKDLHYLPVKIEQDDEDDGLLRLTIDTLDGLAPKTELARQ